MKHTLVFLFILLSGFCSFSLSAQDKIELYNQLEEIGPYKKLNKTFDLKAGEHIILSVTPMQGKLGKIVIDVPESEFKHVTKKVTDLDREVIEVSQSGTYTFHFINTSMFKKEVNIKLYKKRRTIGKDTVILDDVIFTAFRDTIKRYKDDTIPLPDVVDHQFELAPSFRYGSASDSTIREPLIDGVKYQYAAYWIGIGNGALKAYEELKQNPPPSWAFKGINEPLMAYGLGLTRSLPTSNSALARDVMFKFRNPAKAVTRLTRRDKKAGFYAVIPVSSASKYDELILSFRNFNTTSPVPVYVKIVKFKLDRAYYNQYIIRERVQEIFKEKTVKVWAPEED